MTKILKIAALAATMLVSTPALAVGVTGTPPSATARIIKPLSLTSTGALNFGTIVLNNVTADHTVALSITNARDCGGGTGELVCSGTTSVPTYNARGTNNQWVSVIKTASDLTNANDGSTLPFTPAGVDQFQMPNSGTSGHSFNIGGSIVIGASTTDGVYTGTVDVEVDYQ